MVMVDTLEAIRKLRDAGMDESQAEAIVEIIGSSLNDLMTKHDAALLESRIEAKVYRALWIQGAGIVAIVGTFIAIATALG